MKGFLRVCLTIVCFSWFLPVQANDPVTAAKIDILEKKIQAIQSRLGLQANAGVPPAAASPSSSAGVDEDRVLLADLMAKVGSLESQMRSLTGQLEEYDYRLRQQEEAIELLRKELDLQRTDMAATVAANSAVTKPATSNPASGPVAVQDVAVPATSAALPNGTPDEQYKYAFAFVQKNDLANARLALEQFIEANPKDSLTGNARFWLGRVHLQDGRSGQAAQQLLLLIEEHPNHAKRADALVDLADALVKLGSREDACSALQEYRRVKKGDTGRLDDRAARVATDAKCR